MLNVGTRKSNSRNNSSSNNSVKFEKMVFNFWLDVLVILYCTFRGKIIYYNGLQSWNILSLKPDSLKGFYYHPILCPSVSHKILTSSYFPSFYVILRCILYDSSLILCYSITILARY